MRKKFTVCLSHDVDRVKKTFQFISHFFRNLGKREFGSMIYQFKSLFMTSHYWCFEEIMEIERKFDLKSTFFFLNETYPIHTLKPSSWKLGLGYYNIFDPKIKKIIMDLDNQGWEIGLHGSYLSFKDIDLLRKEKCDLEGITGHPILGIRQHYLNIDHQTWEIQAETGFIYDASYGFTDDIGFKEDRYFPFNPLQGRRFYVVPLALMDSCVMKKKNPVQEALKVVKIAEEKKTCLVLNWHQRVFNEKEFPGYKKVYLLLIKECKKRGAHFSTIGEYVSEMD